MAKNKSPEQQELEKLFGTLKDGDKLPKQWQDMFRNMANALNKDSFMVQDTETTDLGEIYEFGAVVYKKGEGAKYVHKFVAKDSKTNLDEVRKRIEEYRRLPNGEIEERYVHDKRVESFANMPTEKQYKELSNKKNFISKKEMGELLQKYQTIPQFAFNAAFDLGQEITNDKNFKSHNLKYDQVYDLMTMAVDILPEVLGANYENGAFGKYKLEKFYYHLYFQVFKNDKQRRENGFFINPRTARQTHAAIEDVMFYTVPVMNYLFKEIQKKAKSDGWSISNFQGVQSYWVHRSKADEELSKGAGFTQKGTKITEKNENLLTGRIASGKIEKHVNFNPKEACDKSMSEVMTKLPAGMLNGKFLEESAKNLGSGKQAAQQARIAELAKDSFKGDLGLKKLLKNLEDTIKSQPGVRNVLYQYEKDKNALRVYIVPEDDTFLATTKNSLKKLPQFVIPFADKDGMISHYGMPGINQWKADVVNGKPVLFTSEQSQIREAIREIKSGYSGYSFRKGGERGYNNFSKQVQGAINKARKSVQVAGTYITDDEELLKTRSGTGSEDQRRFRKSMVDFSRIVQTCMDSSNGLVNKYIQHNKISNDEYSRKRAEAQVSQDIRNILLTLGSYPLEQAERAIRNNKNYKYLFESPVWSHTLFNQVKTLAAIGISAGTSGENSFAHMVFSTMPVTELNALGFLVQKDKRSPVQTTAIKQFSESATAIRNSNSIHDRNRVYTADQIRQGKQPENPTEAMFGYGFINAQQVKKAYDKFKKDYKGDPVEFEKKYGHLKYIGINDGGSFYALGSTLDKALESVNLRTPHVTETELQRKMKSLNGGKSFDNLSEEKLNLLRCRAFKSLAKVPDYIKFDDYKFVYNVEGKVGLEYLELDPTVSGLKVVTDTDQDRLTAQGVPVEFFNYLLGEAGLKGKNVSILKELPKEFKSSQVGGLISGAFHNILNAPKVSSNFEQWIRKNIIQNSNSFFKGCIDESSLSRGYIVLKNTDSLEERLQNYRGDWRPLYNEINQLALAAGVTSGDQKIFIYNKNRTGNNGLDARLNPSFVGLTRIGQADVYSYGAPGGRVVSADYRFRGAIERGLGLISSTAQADMSLLKNFLIEQSSASKENKAIWETMKKDADRILSQSKASATINYEKQKKGLTVTVGYGENYDVDLSQDYDDLDDAYVDGHIDPKRFKKSLLGKIDQVRERKAKRQKTSPENIDVYIDLGKVVTAGVDNKTLSMQHLYIPYFNRLNNANEQVAERGYDLPKYISDYRSVFRTLEKIHQKGFSDNLERDLANHAANAIFSVYNESYTTKGVGYELGNKVRLWYSAQNKANAGNPTLVNEVSDSLSRSIGMYDIIMSKEDITTLLKEVAVEAWEAKEVKKSKTTEHISLLSKQAERLFEGQDWKTELLSFIKREEYSFIEKEIDKEKIDLLKKLEQSWNSGSWEEKAKYNSLEEFLSQTQWLQEQLEKKRVLLSENIQEDLNKLLENGGVSKISFDRINQINEFLAEFLAEAVSLGSNVFNSRINNKTGLESVFSRFPYSNGQDVKFTQVYASNGVKKNRVIVGLGTGKAVNLDFDGDMPPIWLPLLASKAGEYKDLSKQFEVAQRIQRRSTGMVALVGADEFGVFDAYSKEEYGQIKGKKIQELTDFKNQILAAIAGKGNKAKTGELSNLYQTVTNALMRLGLDEASLSQATTSIGRQKVMATLVARAFFEKLTQDAISSKKVYDRLKGDHPNDTPEQLADYVLDDVQKLLGEMRKVLNYDKDGTGIARIVQMASDMKILNFGSDRISAQLLSYANDLVKTREDEIAFKEMFGVEFQKVALKYDEATGDVISIGGIDVSTPEGRAEFSRQLKEGKDTLLGFQLNQDVITKSLTQVNLDLWNQEGRSLGMIMNNFGHDLDVSLGSISKFGDITEKVMANMSKDALLSIKKYKESQQKQEEEVVYDKKSKKFRLVSLQELQKSKSKYDIIFTKIQTNAGHIIGLDEEWMKEDKSREALNNQIDFRYSVTQIGSILHKGGFSEDDFAASYGTLHHAAVEYFIKHGKWTPGDIIEKADLISWLKNTWSNGVGEESKTVSMMFNSEGIINEQRLEMLFNTVNAFFREATEKGMTPDVLVESPMGIVLKIGDEKVLIGGTIDEIWSLGNVEYIGDAKTSSYPYLNYVVQLSLYNAIRRAYLMNQGRDTIVNEKMSLFLTPKNGEGFSGGIIDVTSLTDSQLVDFIADSVSVLREKNQENREKKIDDLIYKWNPTLQSKMSGLGGVDIETYLRRKNEEFPVSKLEKDLRTIYKDTSTTLSFEDWVQTVLSEDAFQEYVSYMYARGQYLKEGLSRLSDQERKSVLNYIEGHYEEMSIKGNTIARHFKIAQRFFGDDAQSFADLKQFYSTHKITPYKADLKTKEEEDQDNMDKQALNALLEGVNILNQGVKALLSGNDAPVGGTAPNKKPKEPPQPSAIAFATEYLSAQDLYSKALNATSKEVKDSFMSAANEKVDILFGPEGTRGKEITLENLFKEGMFTNSETNKGIDISKITPYIKGASMLGELQKTYSNTGANLQTNITNQLENPSIRENVDKEVQKAENETNKIIAKRLALYKELYKIQTQIETATRLGQKDEAERLGRLLAETSGEESIDDVLQGLPTEKAAEIRAEADKTAKKERDRAFSGKTQRYKGILRSIESNDKQLYANDQRYKLTYSKSERSSLNEERQYLLEQQEVLKQQLTEYLEENQSLLNDPNNSEFKKEFDKLTSASDLNIGRGRKAIDVRNHGQHNLWGQLGEQFSGILTRFTEMGAAYKIIGEVRNGINQVTNSAKELDKAMTDLRIVSGQNRKEANSTMRTYADLASQLGMTTSEIATAGNEWLRQGYAINEVNELIQASSYLSKLGMIDMGSAVEKITSALKGFKIEATDAMDVVDKFTALDVEAATTAGDIAEGLSQFANVANINGVDIDEASAMVATIADVSQSSGSEVGNALKTVLSRYSNVKSGAFSDLVSGDTDTEGLNDVEKVLKQIGITIRDSELNFRDFSDVLDDLSVKWQTLDNVTQNAIASALGGRQV